MEGVFWWVAMGWIIWSSRSASDWMPPGTTAVTLSQTQVSFTTARHGKQVVFFFFLEPPARSQYLLHSFKRMPGDWPCSELFFACEFQNPVL
jgi:hypothetical protein